MPDKSSSSIEPSRPQRILVLQGGGALGAYQAGVYEALAKEGFRPQWLAGISIGAINSAIIAGNAPEKRVEALRSFWELVSAPVPFELPFGNHQARAWFNQAGAAVIATFGVPGFFLPRFPSPFIFPPGSPEATSFYDTAPLRATLEKLVDFDRINAQETRLSLGAVNVQTGQLHYFENRNRRIGPEHVMASGALPPGFPPVEIDGEHYWDGGVVSNSPLEHVLDADDGGDLQIFQVDLFSARGPLPRTILDAIEREKDIRYSSRTRHNTRVSLESHEARVALRALLAVLPENLRNDPNAVLLGKRAQDHCVQVVQLIYRSKPYEGGSKDYEFSRQTMNEHWRAGITDVARAMRNRGKLECKPGVAVEVMDAVEMEAAHESR